MDTQVIMETHQVTILAEVQQLLPDMAHLNIDRLMAVQDINHLNIYRLMAVQDINHLNIYRLMAVQDINHLNTDRLMAVQDMDQKHHLMRAKAKAILWDQKHHPMRAKAKAILWDQKHRRRRRSPDSSELAEEVDTEAKVDLNSREQKLKEIYPGLSDKDYKDLVVDYSPDLIPELPIEKGSPGRGPDDPEVPSGQLAGENYALVPRKIFERKRKL